MAPGKTTGVPLVAKTEDWGAAEPLRAFLGPLVDIFKPLISGNMVYGLLVGLLVAAWFGFGYRGQGRQDLSPFFSSPERIAAYEEIWRREESELWEWLEARVGLDRVDDASWKGLPSEGVRRGMEERLKDERASDKEMEIAIEVTEEKLRALKGVMDKKKRA